VVNSASHAGDWSNWRGPEQNGVSREKGLPDKFDVLWKMPYGGRSTPIVQNGRVYVINHSGSKGVTEQERVMCFDAETGKVLWEHKFNVFFTDIVSDRVGWTHPVGDPETGNVYVQGVEGMLFCFDRDGKILWSHSLTEEYGRISGYGGRITSPILDGDLLILSMLNSSWGEYARGGCRFVAFDKKTGQVVWWSETGFRPKDTYYSTPTVAVINGERLLISGAGDGGIHAFQVRTGKKVWSYLFSEGGMVNCAPVVDGNYVYMGNGEGNLHSATQGKVFCLDASQVKDGQPKLVWEVNGPKIKFSSPIVLDGRLYVCDEFAKMYCYDARTGKPYWTRIYGRNAKGSPVWGDGKIYVGQVNGSFSILRPEEKTCQVLHTERFQPQGEGEVEINGSAAIANGKVYFMTNENIYCLGKKGATASSDPIPKRSEEEKADPKAKAAWLQVVPADVVLHPGESATFQARLFDDKGRFLREVKAEWSVAAALPPPPPPPPAKAPPGPTPPVLQGEVDANGKLTVSKTVQGQFGRVEAKAEGLTGAARIRVVPTLPYEQDFSKVPVNRTPGGWVNCQTKFSVQEKGGKNVLTKVNTVASPLVAKANAFIGPPTMTDYVIQADVHGTKVGEYLPDMGVINNRYHFWLSGNAQQLRLTCWDALPRLDQSIAFSWKPDTWYTMKLAVELHKDKAIVRGKIWQRGQPEPKDWTVEVEDPIPNREGSPGLFGNSTGVEGPNQPGTEIWYDNVKVIPNKK
jgi:outer membrane protein assembly factor BamB